jgi:disulfide bond formation protein DsbB
MSELQTPPVTPQPILIFGKLALLVATVTVGGSLYLSIGLNLIACPLCLYQRSFAMASFGVLLIGMASRRAKATGVVCLFAFFPALIGTLIAALHCYLEMTGQLICPQGLFGWGTSPQQSLGSLGTLTLLLAFGVMADMYKEFVSPLSMFVTVLFAPFLAFAAIQGAPEPSMPTPEKMARVCHPPADR